MELYSVTLGRPNTAEIFSNILSDDSGNVTITGWGGNWLNHFSYDIYIIHTDSNANILWSRDIGSPILDEEPVYASLISSGNILFFAGKSGPFGYDTLLGGVITRNGTLEWMKRFNKFSGAVCKTADDGFLIAEQHDFILHRFDSSGTQLWGKQWNVTSSNPVTSLTSSTTGECYIATNTPDSSSGNDVLLGKVDSAGNMIWLKRYSANNGLFGLNKINCLSNGDLIISAGQSVTSHVSQPVIMRIDSAGNILWSFAYQMTNDFWISTIDEFDNGDILFGGTEKIYSPSTLGYLYSTLTVRTNANGSILWSKVYGNKATGIAGACILPSGNVLSSTSTLAASSSDFSVHKFSSSGESCFDTVVQMNPQPITIAVSDEPFLFIADSTINVTIDVRPDTSDARKLVGCSVFVGVEDHPANSSSVHSYPNPFTDKLFFETADESVYSILIFDCTGRFVRGFDSIRNGCAINLQELSPGIYFWKLIDPKGLMENGRIEKVNSKY